MSEIWQTGNPKVAAWVQSQKQNRAFRSLVLGLIREYDALVDQSVVTLAQRKGPVPKSTQTMMLDVHVEWDAFISKKIDEARIDITILGESLSSENGGERVLLVGLVFRALQIEIQERATAASRARRAVSLCRNPDRSLSLTQDEMESLYYICGAVLHRALKHSVNSLKGLVVPSPRPTPMAACVPIRSRRAQPGT